MLAGYTYDSQLFTSEAFRKFQNEFINGNCGVLDGMSVTTTTTTATIANGWAIIKGGLLREQGGTTLSLTDNGYYIVALQIDLSQTNTETEFNQGSFVALRGANAYPTLTQEDLTAGGTLYQLGLAKFQKSDSGITNFTDIRQMLNWTSLYTDYAQELQSLEDLSSVITTDGNKIITGSLTIQGGITGNVTGNVTGNASTATSAGTCTGNSATATKLATTRQINGTNFDGSANITTAKWGTSRNIALSGAVSGNANVDGSGNVTITTTQANTAVLTGTILASNTHSASKSVSFPSGFTKDNCYVLSVLLKHPNQSYWVNGSVFDSSNSFGGLQAKVTLETNITIGIRNAMINTSDSGTASRDIISNYDYKILLMKI